LGTFAPVREKRVEEHKMHAEWFELDFSTADILNKAIIKDRRIVAVGTTATRVLENCAITSLPHRKKNLLIPSSGETKIFIIPGYKFRFIDALITNFHLPHSTPLLLASAFIENGKGVKRNEGIKILLKSYKEAIKKKYRFYSFGDAMLIL
jgi:S-adenosylmethionine:tRNA ribosyltransferase-isomerase